MNTDRLNRELRLLYDCEAKFKIPAAPIVRRLVAESERPLPDTLPPKPAWISFDWPASGSVDLVSYWRGVDRKQSWSGPYL